MDIYDPIGNALGLEKSYLFYVIIEQEYKTYTKENSLGEKDTKLSEMIKELWKNPEYREHQLAANISRSENCKKNVSQPNLTAEQRSALSTKANTNRWKKDYNKKSQSDTFKKLYEDESFKQKYIVSCPHCKKEGHAGAMSRWHFDKCKLLDSTQTRS